MHCFLSFASTAPLPDSVDCLPFDAMSPNHRILLDIFATYGRSLYALIIGLFCGWWVLTAVGKSEFGFCGVVGGMTVITFVACAMRRFVTRLRRAECVISLYSKAYTEVSDPLRQKLTKVNM